MLAAAFPPLHSTDEPFHFDLVVKYAHDHVPTRIGEERLAPETRATIVLYGTGFTVGASGRLVLWDSPEYLAARPPGRAPEPVWTAPAGVRRQILAHEWDRWNVVNHEAREPPVYYALAGLWYDLGRALGLGGGRLFYWTRFLNAPLFAGVVGVAFLFARAAAPARPALALAVATLVAVFPQESFYGLGDDSPLAPLLFAGALWALLRIARAPRPWGEYVLAGVLVAATVLTKYSNVAIVGALVVTLGLASRRATPAARREAGRLALLTLVAAAPVALWLGRNWARAGDLTGAREKYATLHWVVKGPGAILGHPFFGPSALDALFARFGHGVLATFWRGEMVWHGRPLALPALDAFYSLSSLVLLLLAVAGARGARERGERVAIWTSALTVGLGLLSLAVLSTLFDFSAGPHYPSPRWPYFTSGRLLVGVLVPFVTLYVYGLERALAWLRLRGALLPVVLALALLVAGVEAFLTLPACRSDYNWFGLLWQGA